VGPALTDPRGFGAWFGVALEATTFRPGQRAHGRITSAHPDYQNLPLEIQVERMEPERLFSWRWHPGDVEPGRDTSKEPTTLVVFTLEDGDGGTLLTVVESGFEALPADARARARRLNDEGWTEQLRNVERYVSGTSV